ncbi:MAG TPA: TRAP transporter large permease [Thermodesulfobacteriota bacterium]|nr:TRAP transporter large permease [Thermodesulfobacteriota bacterium]
MNEVTVGLLGLVIVLLLFMTGIEMGFAMITIGFLGFGYLISWHAAFNLLAKDFFDVVNTYGFTVIPLFILMGQVAFHSGAAKRLFDTSYKFIGHIPGGLAMTTVVAASTFKAICGSCPATAATFSSVAVPEMDRYHYDKRLSTGVVASVGTLGILLPPSVTLIVYGIITDLSIGRLFLAGIVPGLLTAFFFIAVIVGWCKINPKLGPKGERSTWAERFRSLPEVIWVVLIFLMVIGGILNGFFTPTEAGSVGTFLVLIFAFVRKDLNFKGYIQAGLESLRTACMVMMLIVGSVVLGHFITVTKIPMICADWVVTLQMPSWIIVLMISLIYIVGGSFIDDFAFMIIATPIFYPAITRLGYDPLWFGMLVCLTVMFGLVIPPMAIVVFIVSKITKTPLRVVYSGVYPFLLSIAVVAVLVFLFPPIATWLPGKLMP